MNLHVQIGLLTFSFFFKRSFRYENDDENRKTIVLKKLVVLLTIVNDYPSLTILNDDPSLTIVNDDLR